MDQTLYARSNLNECTVVSDNDNLTLDVVTNLDVSVESIPWVWSELLETESDTLLLLIEVDDNNVDLVVRQEFFRLRRNNRCGLDGKLVPIL